MILSKLYSNNPKFKDISFNEGFNIIVANYTKTTIDKKSNTHGLGKTSVARLIDFLLLKELKSNFFLKKHSDKFQGWEFFLEIKLNNGKYLTIKRGVDKNRKISFSLNEASTDSITVWNDEDLTLEKAKEKLNSYLSFDVLKDYNYRTFLRYIIREQEGGYSKLFETLYGKDIEWKPKLLSLFDLNSDEYKAKIKKEEEKKLLKDKFSKVGEDYLAVLEEKKQYLIILEDKIKSLEEEINNFNYYGMDYEISEEVSNKLQIEISKLNRERFSLQTDITNIQERLKEKTIKLDLEELEDLFKEVEVYFGETLKKDYSDLIEFNKAISSERSDHLKKSLVIKEERLEKIGSELKTLNKRQSEVLEILSQKDKVKKIIEHQSELNNLEVIKNRLEVEIEFLDEGKDQLKKVAEIDIEISKLKIEIQEVLEKKSALQNRISDLLREISTSIFSLLRASLIISPNGKGNPDFSLKLRNIIDDKITSEDDGNHKNMFMVSIFDISLLVAYIEHSFYRFLFHDGNIEGTDHRMKKSYITTVKKYIKDYNFQYITTAIKDQIIDVNDVITEDDIILELNDEGEAGTLFGFKF
jgi:uncharacterized protein YydD (DUF2326 family)